MQAHNYLFMGTGAVIAGYGLWCHGTIPRLYAAHAADVASREPVVGEVVDYELDREDNTFTRLIEYEVNGHRYRMRGWDTVREKVSRWRRCASRTSVTSVQTQSRWSANFPGTNFPRKYLS